MDFIGFINELLQAFRFYCMALFEVYIIPGMSYGSVLVTLAIFSLFMRIVIVRLKNG